MLDYIAICKWQNSIRDQLIDLFTGEVLRLLKEKDRANTFGRLYGKKWNACLDHMLSEISPRIFAFRLDVDIHDEAKLCIEYLLKEEPHG